MNHEEMIYTVTRFSSDNNPIHYQGLSYDRHTLAMGADRLGLDRPGQTPSLIIRPIPSTVKALGW